MTYSLFDDSVFARNDGMVPIAKLSELEIGKSKRILVEGQAVLLTVISLSGPGVEISAFSAICPHALGDLSQGWVTGNEVECPLHYYRFNMQTGECVSPHGGPHLRLYPLKIEGDVVLISVQKPRWMASSGL
jgi:nitrite reductase/ring-hydroxylating ferredoxin subunit